MMDQKWWHYLTGGRPMRFITFMFIDEWDRRINYYIDAFDRRWMATSRWSNFRVTPNHGPEIWKDDKQ